MAHELRGREIFTCSGLYGILIPSPEKGKHPINGRRLPDTIERHRDPIWKGRGEKSSPGPYWNLGFQGKCQRLCNRWYSSLVKSQAGDQQPETLPVDGECGES